MTTEITPLDAHAHAACILEALDNDLELALEFVPTYFDYYGYQYTMQLVDEMLILKSGMIVSLGSC